MAGTTGLEPATSAVTGQRSNQLNYVPRLFFNNMVICHIEFRAFAAFAIFALFYHFAAVNSVLRLRCPPRGHQTEHQKTATATTKSSLPDESVFWVSASPSHRGKLPSERGF